MKRRHVETMEVLAGDHLSDQLNTAAGRVHQHLRDALQVPELAPQHHDVAQVQLSKAGQEGVAGRTPRRLWRWRRHMTPPGRRRADEMWRLGSRLKKITKR